MPDYEELQGYPQEHYGENGHFYAERRVKCLWADRHDVLIAVGQNGGELYPYWKPSGALATGAAILPLPLAKMDKDTCKLEFPSEASYNYAVVVIKYSTYQMVKLGGLLVTEELQPSQKLLNLDIQGLTWDDGGDEDAVQPGDSLTKLLPSFDYVVTYHNLDDIPAAAYIQVGKINSDPVTSHLLGLTFDVNTLLHTRPTVRRKFEPGTPNKMFLSYRFAFHPKTWQHFWDLDEWYRVKDDSGLVDVYEEFPFETLVPT